MYIKQTTLHAEKVLLKLQKICSSYRYGDRI